MMARILAMSVSVYFIFSDLMGQSTVSKDARSKARERGKGRREEVKMNGKRYLKKREVKYNFKN